jgi:tRNA threonylcarbamoyladenosine biosynthesis protein TsaE
MSVPPKMLHDSHSIADTELIAADLASTLRGGECVALDGDLGAGKTQFVRGIVGALGGDARQVSSPTFVLLHIYDCRPPLRVYHLDAYRVAGADDFEGIGFAELLEDENGIVVVEWAGKVADLLPANRIQVQLEVTGQTSRRIMIHHEARA